MPARPPLRAEKSSKGRGPSTHQPECAGSNGIHRRTHTNSAPRCTESRSQPRAAPAQPRGPSHCRPPPGQPGPGVPPFQVLPVISTPSALTCSLSGSLPSVPSLRSPLHWCPPPTPTGDPFHTYPPSLPAAFFLLAKGCRPLSPTFFQPHYCLFPQQSWVTSSSLREGRRWGSVCVPPRASALFGASAAAATWSILPQPTRCAFFAARQLLLLSSPRHLSSSAPFFFPFTTRSSFALRSVFFWFLVHSTPPQVPFCPHSVPAPPRHTTRSAERGLRGSFSPCKQSGSGNTSPLYVLACVVHSSFLTVVGSCFATRADLGSGGLSASARPKASHQKTDTQKLPPRSTFAASQIQTPNRGAYLVSSAAQCQLSHHCAAGLQCSGAPPLPRQSQRHVG